MSLTAEDLRVYKCPKCKKTGTYKDAGIDNATKQRVYECSNPKCGRKVGGKSLERDLRKKD